MQSIASNIFYETIYPGVTLGAVIMPRGTLMIDAPLRAEDARTWKSMLLTHSRGTHRILLNLDGHADRTLGARYMDCTVMSQQNALEAFNTRTSVFKGHSIGSSAEWENYPEVSGTRWSIPSLTYSERITFHWGEDSEIIVEHHPGPSSGASWVIIPSEKVVFIGDAILLDQPPFLAMSNLPNWIETLSELRSPRYRDYTIISGRGGPVSIEYVREQHEQIKALHKRLEALAEKGGTYIDTETLMPSFLDKLKYPAALHSSYEQRLRYGLGQYYQNHYSLDENEVEN